jgi:hypothetical protein
VVTKLRSGGTAVRERDAREARRTTGHEQLALLVQLRAVDHWRRLVAARLDLAVAAVATPDEPAVPGLLDLHDLLGLAPPGTARSEAALLLRLRAAQRELDAYAAGLRASVRAATADVVTRLDDSRRPAGTAAAPGLQGSPDDAVALVLPLRRRAGGRSASPGPASRSRPDDVA